MPETMALISTLILERPLCRACVAAKAGLTPAEVDAALARIQRVLEPRLEGRGRCRACGTIGVVVSLARPAD
jgi:hypothetical protein